MDVDDNTMCLPLGKTCGDCLHLRRCKMLFGCKPTNVVCDWAPSRFIEVTPADSPCRDGEGNVSHDFMGNKCIKCGKVAV